MGTRFNTLRDARGTPRRTMRASDASNVAAGLEGVEQPLSLGEARDAAHGTRSKLPPVIWLAACFVLAAVIHVVSLEVLERNPSLKNTWLESVFMGLFMLGVFGGPAAALLVSRGKTPAQVQAIVRRCGRCLACGYELRGLKQEPDGCKICPECSAAWRD